MHHSVIGVKRRERSFAITRLNFFTSTRDTLDPTGMQVARDRNREAYEAAKKWLAGRLAIRRWKLRLSRISPKASN